MLHPIFQQNDINSLHKMMLLYRNRVCCLFSSFKSIPFFPVKQCPQIFSQFSFLVTLDYLHIGIANGMSFKLFCRILIVKFSGCVSTSLYHYDSTVANAASFAQSCVLRALIKIASIV